MFTFSSAGCTGLKKGSRRDGDGRNWCAGVQATGLELLLIAVRNQSASQHLDDSGPLKKIQWLEAEDPESTADPIQRVPHVPSSGLTAEDPMGII